MASHAPPCRREGARPPPTLISVGVRAPPRLGRRRGWGRRRELAFATARRAQVLCRPRRPNCLALSPRPSRLLAEVFLAPRPELARASPTCSCAAPLGSRRAPSCAREGCAPGCRCARAAACRAGALARAEHVSMPPPRREAPRRAPWAVITPPMTSRAGKKPCPVAPLPPRPASRAGSTKSNWSAALRDRRLRRRAPQSLASATQGVTPDAAGASRRRLAAVSARSRGRGRGGKGTRKSPAAQDARGAPRAACLP